MEEGVDKLSRHSQELGKLGLQEVVVVLVLASSQLKVLLDLEQVLLVLERLLLLVSQLVEAVVVTVVVDELVVALCASLSNLLADVVQLPAGLNDARLDKVKLRLERFCPCQRGSPVLVVPFSSSMSRW